jgi:glycosyl transferase family 25
MTLPPIWIVSLEGAAERRAFVTRAFGNAGLPYEVVDAVDGRSLTTAERHRYSQIRARYAYGRALTEGDVGCVLSHLRLFQRMLDDDVPEALIVEDDVGPAPGLTALLEARAAFPSDAGVVTLCSLFGSSGPRPIDDEVIAGRFRVCTYDRTPFGTQCYLVTQAAARRVLDVAYPIRMPIDELVYRRHPAGLRVYGIEPRAVVIGQFASESILRPDAVRAGVLSEVIARPVVFAGRVHRRARRDLDRRRDGAKRR